MIVRKLCIIAFGLLLGANMNFAQINRPYEPIVLKGDTLAQFLNYEIKYLYLYAYEAATDNWRMMPFQIDEVNPKDQDSMYFKPDDSFGLLDSDDELVFLLNDLGDRAPATSWLFGADSQRCEISIEDPLDGNRGYAYLYSSKSNTESIPTDYQMAYNPSNDHVRSKNYEVGFNETGQLGDAAIISGSGTDIFDRLKIRAFGWFLVVFVYLDETTLSMNYAYAKAGPVRVIRNMQGQFYWKQLNLKEEFTQTSFFYPWNGEFKLFEIPIGDAIDIGAKVDLIRVSWDFNGNTKGMKFYSEFNRAGVPIDTTTDNVDATCLPDKLNWTMGTGDQGTLLNIFYIPPLGDKIRLYYYDEHDGKTNDPGLKFDTGDGLSFADNGFSLEENIEQYAAAESTFDVIYYNFFLPPNFDPGEAQRICEQHRSPVSYAIKIDTLSRPALVDQNNTFFPDEFFLGQNYPNPFNASTTVLVNLPRQTRVLLQIFDALGQLVRTLVDQELPQGTYHFVWNARDNEGLSLPTGLYFCRMTSPEFNSIKKILLIK